MKNLIFLAAILFSSSSYASEQTDISKPIGSVVMSDSGLAKHMADGNVCINKAGVSSLGAIFTYGGITFECKEGISLNGITLAGWVVHENIDK